MGPPAGEGAAVAGPGAFALVKRLAGRGHAQDIARDPAPLRYVGVPPASSLHRGSSAGRPNATAIGHPDPAGR
jgi:hypothetical protein